MPQKETSTSTSELSIEEEILLQLDSLNSAEKESLQIQRKQLSLAHDNGAIFAPACTFGFAVAASDNPEAKFGTASMAASVFIIVFLVKAIRALRQ
jgi:hypothetical protein